MDLTHAYLPLTAKATPSPPIGPALGTSLRFTKVAIMLIGIRLFLFNNTGARGIRSADFCKEFNARTAHITPGTPTPVKMNIDMTNKSFTFIIKSPPTSWLLMQAAGVDKGAGDPPAGKALILLGNAPNPALPGGDPGIPTVGFKEIGSVTLKHIYEIAKIKKQDEHLKHIPLESLARSVLGTSRNIGIRVTRK